VAIIPFRIEEEAGPDDVRIIAVRGELDLGTAPELERALEGALEEPRSLLLLDLTDCEFMDSTGVALIVRSWQRHDATAGNGGSGRLELCCPTPQVKRLLEVTGIGAAVTTHPDRESALAAMAG
jgi:anti-sigma B factor antagonist